MTLVPKSQRLSFVSYLTVREYLELLCYPSCIAQVKSRAHMGFRVLRFVILRALRAYSFIARVAIVSFEGANEAAGSCTYQIPAT